MLALVTGLLNFPSTCQCGAELPHPHSLFLLADHHHSPDGEIDTSEHDHADHAVDGSLRQEVTGPGPIVQGAVPEGMATDQIGAVLSRLTLWTPAGEMRFAGWQLFLPISSMAESPDPPPPRT